MLFTYKCEDGHITERLRRYENRKLHSVCKVCNKEAYHIQEFSLKSRSFGITDKKWDMREKKRLNGASYV